MATINISLPDNDNAESAYTTFIISPSGSGKSVLETILFLQGAPFIAGPVHTDNSADFAEAARAAHNIEACLPLLHDVILDVTGASLTDEQLRAFLATLPAAISAQIDDWGLADTEVREHICGYLRQTND